MSTFRKKSNYDLEGENIALFVRNLFFALIFLKKSKGKLSFKKVEEKYHVILRGSEGILERH